MLLYRNLIFQEIIHMIRCELMQLKNMVCKKIPRTVKIVLFITQIVLKSFFY